MPTLNRSSISILKNWLLAGVGVVVVVVTINAFTTVCSVVRVSQTRNELKWIGLALHNYHDQHGSFPPAVIRDADGNALHSWRTLLLPYLYDDLPREELSHVYRLNEPWDSPFNSEAGSRLHLDTKQYQYLAIVGPEAAWKPEGTRSVKEFQDGSYQTLLVIAVRDTGINWHQPVDATVEDSKLFLNAEPLDTSQDVYVLFADGSVYYHAEGIPPDQLPVMITIDAGDKVEHR